MSDLPESRLYTFLDDAREFALYFLEGQRLIEDVALRTGVSGGGFAYFRDTVLSVQPMIALVKRGEQFGFYIDGDEPRFRLKIETAHHGDMRCAVVPAEFHEFPEGVRGLVRLIKLFPGGRPPYESILELDGTPLREIVNLVLKHSYQVHCAVMVSPHSDQSAMLHQLPPIAGRDEYVYSMGALWNRRESLERELEPLFRRALSAPDEIRGAMERLGFRYLADRTIRFRCSCSRERMIRNIRGIANVEPESLFDPGQEVLDVTCEYCKERYEIGKTEVTGPPETFH
jgi:molecular chaperone Hsp33